LWEEGKDLKDLAIRIISTQEAVSHVDPDDVLFLWEREQKPKATARTYRLVDLPIQFFTDKRFCIVFYWQRCDYMSPAQLAILMLHELMHIPETGDKLIDHDIKDFRAILGLDLDWSEPGREVPNILEVSSDVPTKADRVQTDAKRGGAVKRAARPRKQTEEHR
jgi:predicted metallopeptidase